MDGPFKHTHCPSSERHLGDLCRHHLSDPVLAILAYVFSSNLKSARNFHMTVVASQFFVKSRFYMPKCFQNKNSQCARANSSTGLYSSVVDASAADSYCLAHLARSAVVQKRHRCVICSSMHYYYGSYDQFDDLD